MKYERSKHRRPQLDRQTRNAFLQALYRLNPKSEPTTGFLNRLALTLKALLTIVFCLFSLPIILLVGLTQTLDFFRNEVVIEPFEIPNDIQIKCMNGRQLASRLMDEMLAIRNEVSGPHPQGDFVIKEAWHDEKFQIGLSVGGITVEHFLSSIRNRLCSTSWIVSGDIVAINNNNDDFELTIRSEFPPKKVKGSLSNLKPAMQKAAETVWLEVKPILLAYYHLFTDTDVRKEACIRTVKHIIRTKPESEHAEAYAIWGDALAQQRDFSGATNMYNRATNIASTSEEVTANIYNNWGASLSQQRDYDAAIETYKKSINLYGHSSAPYINWGRTLSNMDRHREAEGLLRKALTIRPKSVIALLNLGIALKSQGKLEEAISTYREAANTDPAFCLTYYNWGNALLVLQKYDEAISMYNRAIDCEPHFPHAYRMWCVALDGKQEYGEAISKCEKAIEMEPSLKDVVTPDIAKVYNNWGVAQGKLGLKDDAISKFERAIEFDPRNALPYSNIGNILLEMGKNDGAIEMLQQAAQRSKDDPKMQEDLNIKISAAYYSNGTSLISQKRYSEAIANFEKATQKNPTDASAYLKWGFALNQLKEYAKACDKFENAVRLNPELAAAYFQLGEALRNLGRHNEAIESYRKAMQLDNKYKIGAYAPGRYYEELRAK